MKHAFSRPNRTGPVRGWSRRVMGAVEPPAPPEPAPAPRFLRQGPDGSLTRGERTDRFRRSSRP